MASLRLRVVALVASIEWSSRWASLWFVDRVKLSRCCSGELLTAGEGGLEVGFDVIQSEQASGSSQSQGSVG
jgi:hypothetical protein